MPAKKTERICDNGHAYFKSSDCPVCPLCEKGNKPSDGFLSVLSAPARRALENEGITSLKQLSTYSQKDILKLHGIGPSAIPKLLAALQENNLDFKK